MLSLKNVDIVTCIGCSLGIMNESVWAQFAYVFREVGMSLFSIGYGSRKVSEFVSLLEKYSISYLIDVRTKPYSKFNGDFSQNNLRRFLDLAEVKYVYMGDTLGGLPVDDECYTDGRVDYQKTARSDAFKTGLNRLIRASNIPENVIVMCSEGKPHECHRCKLIGVELQACGVNIMHVDENGLVITQDEAYMRLTQGQESMFGHALTSNKKYR